MGGGWLEFIAIRRVYMGLCGQGSRGRGISAIGGWQWGGVPVPVFTGGRLFAGTTERGMGPRPPSSRGQDLDARTTRGRAARFLGSVAALGMICGSGERRDGFPSPFSRGQALRGNNGGRDGFPPPLHGGRIFAGRGGMGSRPPSHGGRISTRE